MIVGRLLYFRARLNRVTAEKYGSQYTSIVAILVESAASYSSYYVLLFLIPFALGPKSEVASIVSELFPNLCHPFRQALSLFYLLEIVAETAYVESRHFSSSSVLLKGTEGGRMRM
jgi:hypothetical protein